MYPEIWHHEQTQVVHQLCLYQLYAEPLILLTQEQYNDFRQQDMIRMTSGPTSLDPTTPMTTFTGHTKGSIASETQVALNNFQKGTKRDTSAYPIFKKLQHISEIHLGNHQGTRTL